MAENTLTPVDSTESKFMALVKFDVKKEELIKLANSTKDLTIADEKDKEGYKKVNDAQMVLRDIRKKGEEDRLSFKRMLLSTGEKLDEYHKSIFSPIIDEEKRLKGMKDEIKQKIEEQKQEKIRIEQERKVALVLRFGELGLMKGFDGPFVFMDLVVEESDLFTMEPEELDVLEEKIRAMGAAEKLRLDIIEEERKKKEAELAATEAAQAARQKILDDKEAAMKKKEDDLNAEKEKIAAAEAEKKREAAEVIRLAEVKKKTEEETAARIKKETADAAIKLAAEEKAAEEKAAKNKKYIAWLEQNGASLELLEKREFIQERTEESITLYKKVASISKVPKK